MTVTNGLLPHIYKQCNAANDGKTFFEIHPTPNRGESYPVKIKALNPNGSSHSTCDANLELFLKFEKDAGQFGIEIIEILESLLG